MSIILYSTSFAATLKIRSDITKITHILDSKKIPYEIVDLTEKPYRRRDMLKNSDNNITLPQLHVNNRFIGTVDEIQEFEDWGELDAILRGVSPGKLAAAAVAAGEAQLAAYLLEEGQKNKLITGGEATPPQSPITSNLEGEHPSTGNGSVYYSIEDVKELEININTAAGGGGGGDCISEGEEEVESPVKARPLEEQEEDTFSHLMSE